MKTYRISYNKHPFNASTDTRARLPAQKNNLHLAGYPPYVRRPSPCHGQRKNPEVNMRTISLSQDNPEIGWGLVFPVSGSSEKLMIIIAAPARISVIPASVQDAVAKETGVRLNPLADPLETEIIKTLINKNKYDIFLYTRPGLARLVP